MKQKLVCGGAGTTEPDTLTSVRGRTRSTSCALWSSLAMETIRESVRLNGFVECGKQSWGVWWGVHFHLVFYCRDYIKKSFVLSKLFFLLPTVWLLGLGRIFVHAIEKRHIRWHVIPPLKSNHGECWHRPQGHKEGFSPAAAKRHAGRWRLVTRLSCYSFDYSRNISPPPLSVFDFPLRGKLRAEIQQAQQGHHRAALCKHCAHRCAWKGTKKRGDAYAIRT